jgi:hypothetical protein
LQPLTRDDVIVVWDGTNYMGKNESSKGPSRISSFIKNRGHTNIAIMNAPTDMTGHDLHTASCINNEVKVFNRKLLNK